MCDFAYIWQLDLVLLWMAYLNNQDCSYTKWCVCIMENFLIEWQECQWVNFPIYFNPCHTEFIFVSIKDIFTNIAQDCDGAVSENVSSWKKGMLIPYSQCHGHWWPGAAGIHGINSNGTDLFAQNISVSLLEGLNLYIFNVKFIHIQCVK